MFLNISAYRFCELDQLEALRDQILAQCQKADLKGTIILAPEGINMFLAGPQATLHSFFTWLNQYPALANIVTKDSFSDYQPFKKMLVKIKDEIIRMNHPTIQAFKKRAPSISATTLKEWIKRGTDDAGKELVLLDTRNAFEVDYGTFQGAIHFHLDKFSEFPQVIAKEVENFQDKTVVTFCTGGIRCEKANLFMQEIGLHNTLQLDGGILKYFEEVGQDFYDGGCFVFDDRIALDAELAEHPIENAPRRPRPITE